MSNDGLFPAAAKESDRNEDNSYRNKSGAWERTPSAVGAAEYSPGR